jgi:hypothetical protein
MISIRYKASMYFPEAQYGSPIPNTNYTLWGITQSVKLRDGNNSSWSVGLKFPANTKVLPGTTHIVEVAFLSDGAYEYFKPGDQLYFCAGRKVMAQGKIE